MKTLLLEIGTEEIPAGYIAPALAALESMLTQKLADARIAHGRIQTFGTPRRLSVTVAELAARQKRLTSEVLGPPRKVGYDSDGRPTTAAVKFAEKVGLPVNRLGVAATPKGEYLSATVTDPGVATTALLKTVLPDIILAIPFPKRMRWADLTISFARPIHSLLALYGGSRIGFTLGGIRSGRTTFGHRFMHPRSINVAEPAAYVEALRSGFVIVDAAERRRLIAEGAAQAAASVGGHILPDEELLGTVTQLVEYPAVAVGRFAEAFLELPAEVLITAMREHQKYFAVVDAGGRLLPHFVAVNNTPVQDMAVVVRGHERVLRARLEDAKFFFRSDRETSLDTMVEKLKSVLFQAQLGSIYDKVRRVRELSRFVADRIGGDPELGGQVERAAWLCKADLVSQMVGEFPKLQGIMGRVYAKAQGEPAAVASAIEEHYRPTYSGGALPETTVGAVVAIADKLDTICGCFRAGLAPTGAADPYALRRQGIGVIQIMRSHGLAFSLSTRGTEKPEPLRRRGGSCAGDRRQDPGVPGRPDDVHPGGGGFRQGHGRRGARRAGRKRSRRLEPRSGAAAAQEQTGFRAHRGLFQARGQHHPPGRGVHSRGGRRGAVRPRIGSRTARGLSHRSIPGAGGPAPGPPRPGPRTGGHAARSGGCILRRRHGHGGGSERPSQSAVAACAGGRALRHLRRFFETIRLI